MFRLTLSLVAVLCGLSTGFAQAPRVTMPKILAVIRPDVQADLKLTDDQIAKVKEKTGEIVREGPNGVVYLTAGPDTDLDAFDAEIEKVLDEKQRKRLKECWLQILGPRALLDGGIAKEVGLRPDQQKELTRLEEDQREKMRELAITDGAPTEEDLQKIRAQQAEYQKQITQVLTPEQKQKLKTLQGTPFRNKMNPAGAK